MSHNKFNNNQRRNKAIILSWQMTQNISIPGAGETARNAERLARELNNRKNNVTKSVSDYHNLLQMIIAYLRKLKDVSTRKRQLEFVYS